MPPVSSITTAAAAVLCLLLIRRRRNQQRRFKRCLRCNPNAVFKRSNSESASTESNSSNTSPGECTCTSNNSSLITESKTTSVDQTNEESSILTLFNDNEETKPEEILPQKCLQPNDNLENLITQNKTTSVDQTAQKSRNLAKSNDNTKPIEKLPENCFQPKNNVANVNNPIADTEPTMRRYPIATEDISYKYLVGRSSNLNTGIGQNACSSSRTGESYTRQMAEIEYWVKTHRPPCTYGMPLSSTQSDSSPAVTTATTTKAEDTKQKDSGIKRPLDPDISSETSATKKLSTHVTDEESPKPTKNKYFSSVMNSPQSKSSKLNGNIKGVSKSKLNCKNTNGLVSAESATNARGIQTSTPVTSPVTKNGTRKRNYSTNETPKSIEVIQKITKSSKDDIEIEKTPEKLVEPSQAIEKESPETKKIVMNDSDTSVLTAPYIRSTRNGATRTKCQSLTRQRASQTQTKLFSTRSFTKRRKEKDHLQTSTETKESSVANNSKLSDSSLDIFGVDVTKESTNSRKSTLRSSSGNLPTLHFSGCKASGEVKRSEPVVTRNSAKRALLSKSCHPNLPDNSHNSFGNNSAPCISKIDSGKTKVTSFLNSDKDIFSKKTFFL